MSYLKTLHVGRDMLEGPAAAAPPFGPGFTQSEIAEAVKMEVWCSEFTDQGEDFTEFVLRDAQDQQVARRRVPGY